MLKENENPLYEDFVAKSGIGRVCWMTTGENVTFNEEWSAIDQDSTAVKAIKVTWIICVSVAIVILNVMMIVVLHSRHHSHYLREQPRILMTSLACTDLAVGLLVSPFCLVSAIRDCWPFGEFLCSLEALLISALFHESTLSLVSIAIDRYVCIVHPLRYHSLITKKVCIVMIWGSWIFSFAAYSFMIFPSRDYVYDHNGILTCEPNYTNKSIIILATTFFYCPPVAILIYTYTTIFYIARKQFKRIRTAPPPAMIFSRLQRCDSVQKLQEKEKLKNYKTAMTLATIAFGYFMSVTPWTITELVMNCWNVSVPRNIQFAVSWLALSNSFWNPIIYGILNKSFRQVVRDLVERALCSVKITRNGNVPTSDLVMEPL